MVLSCLFLLYGPKTIICHCIMRLELFWVNTDPICSVIPSCLQDELWERVCSMCTKDCLGNAIFFLWTCHNGNLVTTFLVAVNDKCLFLFSVNCFGCTQKGDTYFNHMLKSQQIHTDQISHSNTCGNKQQLVIQHKNWGKLIILYKHLLKLVHFKE